MSIYKARLGKSFILVAAMFFSVGALGETLQTEVIKPEVGFSLEKSGLQVESVTDEGGAVRVEISLPKNGKADIEEVVVVATKNKPVVDAPKKGVLTRVEVVNDLDKDRSGIVVYFGKRQQFQLTINYYAPKNP